jgi:tetratricopeptide (TPR) repeat protein
MEAGRRFARVGRLGLAALACALLAACGTAALERAGAGAPAAAEDPNDPALRIRLQEARLRAEPTRAAVHAELGAAYLDMARATGDAAWLGRARSALARSLELEPGPAAHATLAELCNFSHRFACALEHAEQIARLAPRDGRARTLRIEAYLGLGELRRAEQLLAQPGNEDGAAFVLAAARGRCLAEQQRHDDARKAFTTAAEQARSAGAAERELWAELHAARAMIDSGRPGLARTHLDSASRLPAPSWSMDALRELHWAEVHQLEQRPEEALRTYEAILVREKDPEIYRRAYTLARQLGQTRRADELFAAAEAGAERILAAGEVFTLEAQARLYADAGVKLERAEELAQKNLEHKRDRSAYETLAYVRKQRAERASR